jgi:sugar phosphate isomerase/epimerase
MPRTLSTYLFVKRKLTSQLVTEIARYDVQAVELFCARGHLDYRSQDAVRELGAALRDHNLAVGSVHAPAERELGPTRESSAPLSISDLERTRRLEAVDEIKRVLDMAEDLPFRYLVQHFGSSRDDADPRRFDAAFNSLEHLHIFAKQRGVTIALENTPGELGTPANLRQFIADTRLTDLRLCFDIGHAHLEGGVLPNWEVMRDLVVTTHIHDNHGDKDEHLPPYQGDIDWKAAFAALAASPNAHVPGPALAPAGAGIPLVLELKEQPAQAEPAPPSVALELVRNTFDQIARQAESAPD